MKKFVIASLITLAAATASAANFVSLDIENVEDSVTSAKSTAQYLRVGKELAGLQLGLQSRTSRSSGTRRIDVHERASRRRRQLRHQTQSSNRRPHARW